MCMILWDVVSSRALLRLRKKLPFEKYMEAPLHNEQAAQWFQENASAVSCHQVARHAPNHPASVRTLTIALTHSHHSPQDKPRLRTVT